jgi:hypothetical protein
VSFAIQPPAAPDDAISKMAPKICQRPFVKPRDRVAPTPACPASQTAPPQTIPITSQYIHVAMNPGPANLLNTTAAWPAMATETPTQRQQPARRDGDGLDYRHWTQAILDSRRWRTSKFASAVFCRLPQ